MWVGSWEKIGIGIFFLYLILLSISRIKLIRFFISLSLTHFIHFKQKFTDSRVNKVYLYGFNYFAANDQLLVYKIIL